jgi:large subunit ribosomal protein L46
MTTILPNTLVSSSRASFEREEHGLKAFFMKARIMAGQADLAKNAYGDQEFAWLTREEIMERCKMDYASSVKGMLATR